MLNGYTLIHDYVQSILGTYSPVEVNGEYFLDWSYLIAGALLVIACYFCFRGFLMLLKGVLGSYV